MSGLVRHPAVAGRFYPDDAAVLSAEVRSYLAPQQERIAAIGCIAPHAGYMYSGHVAGAVYSRSRVPLRCIVLCPNHTGRGKPLSIMSEGWWETPLGNITIDANLASALKQRFPALAEDAEAHRAEHAVEVQLPFLQVCREDAKFVPIALGTGRFEILQALGEAVGEVLEDSAERVLLIASSDMNHYENGAITRVKDQKAIERILALDPAGLFEVVMREQISMCGFGPAVVMLTAARKLGASRAELVKYATSADVSGDSERVVGYAGMLVA